MAVKIIGWTFSSPITIKQENDMKNNETKITDGIDILLVALSQDYIRWSNICEKAEKNRPRTELELKYPEMNKRDPKIYKDMIKEYCEGLEVKEGSKYFKIISNTNGCSSVLGFIVKYGDKKFLEGDMLKPAGWAKPARNFARGNVLNKVIHVRWTGIN